MKRKTTILCSPRGRGQKEGGIRQLRVCEMPFPSLGPRCHWGTSDRILSAITYRFCWLYFCSSCWLSPRTVTVTITGNLPQPHWIWGSMARHLPIRFFLEPHIPSSPQCHLCYYSKGDWDSENWVTFPRSQRKRQTSDSSPSTKELCFLYSLMPFTLVSQGKVTRL